MLLIPAQFVHPACNFLYPPFLVLAWSRRLLYFLTMPADADCICISSDFLYLFLIVFLLVLPISLTWSRRLLHFPTSLIVMHHLTAGNQEKSARSTRFISLSKDLSAKLSAFALASKQMGENECKLGLISFEHDEIPKYDFTPVYTLHCSLIEQLLRHPALVKHTCSKGQMSRF